MPSLASTWWKIVTNRIYKSDPVSRMSRVVKVAFSDKYLLYTNITISVSLSALGDILEQSYEVYTRELENYSSKRTMHMALSGATIGILCHNWYKVLDKVIIGKTVGMVTRKLLLDQLIFSPIMIITFFGTLAIFEEDPFDNFKNETAEKFGRLYKAEWLIWPPAQIINFYYLPTRFRVLYDNTISLGYDIYTSQVKHTKNVVKNAS